MLKQLLQDAIDRQDKNTKLLQELKKMNNDYEIQEMLSYSNRIALYLEHIQKLTK